MKVPRKIVLTIICGFVVMHVSHLGLNSIVNQLPWHSPVITPGASRSLAKFEHKYTVQTLQRRGVVRDMSSAVVTEEFTAPHVKLYLQVSCPSNTKPKLVVAYRVLTTRLWKTMLVALL